MSDFDIGHRTGVKATTAGALVIGAVVFAIMGQAVLAIICGVLVVVMVFQS